MRLGELLGRQNPSRIDELCRRVVPGAEEVATHMRAHSLESMLRDSGYVEQTLHGRRPPILAMMREILEADGFFIDQKELRTRSLEMTELWCRRVADGELAARRENFAIYRRLLAAAWESDMKLDGSELTLLALLRKELGMTAAEHFLISHHPDVQPFWQGDDIFQHELDALSNHGILYVEDGSVVLPEEFAPRVRRALGLFMGRSAARRLLDSMSSEDLAGALEALGIRKSGDKTERILRIVQDVVPIQDVLDAAHIHELQEIARKTGAAVSGTKGELIERLIAHFDEDGDVRAHAASLPTPVVAEPKELTDEGFRKLLSPLTGHQLQVLCMEHELKHSGTKEIRMTTLWESPYSERTLLRSLRNPELSALCREHSLDPSGPKEVMIDRLVSAHRTLSVA